ncbi:MAG: iron-sulfur cluster assembly scaffold protein [Candidatus Nanoarchaeia archaeon]
MNQYSKKVIEHFKHPKNMGKLENPDAVGKIGNPVCGDVMEIYLKINKKQGKDYIEEISFQTMGCAAAIATSSMITQLAKGKTLQKAKSITQQDIAASLEGLPPIKMHCSNLAASALKKAIENWETKNTS